jgi:non-ribosomal peptide synthetase component F
VSAEASRPRPRVDDIYPLSPMQHGMLVDALRDGAAGIDVVQMRYELHGELDPGALEQAWRQAAERHAALRTAFTWERLERPLQVVHHDVALPLARHDWRGLARDEQERLLGALLDAERRRGWVLTRPPLLRLALARLADDAHVLVISLHHLVLDGWSTALLMREVAARYQAVVAGTRPALAAPRPFSEYVAWLGRQDLSIAEAHWRRALAGFAAATPLPGDRGGAGDRRGGDREVGRTLPADLSERARALAAGCHLTLGTVVQGAWALLLGHAAGTRDVVFGTVVSGRPPELPGIESMLGLFINTLPLRVALPGAATVAAWLAGVQEGSLELRRFEHSPLAQVGAWSQVPAGRPLFESVLVYENYPFDASFRARPASLEIRHAVASLRESTPLTVEVAPGERLELKVRGDGGRFETGALEALAARFEAVLDAVATSPERRLEDLERALGPAGRGPAERPAAPARDAGRVAPGSPTERRLARIWGELLEVEGVAATDDFFALGGHSLSALRLLARMRETFQVDLRMRDLFAARTLAAQASRIDASPSGELGPTLRPGLATGATAPLSFAQERLWFLDRLDPGSNAYSIPTAVRIAGPLDVPALQRAIDRVVERHEILRTAFPLVGDGPVQTVAPSLTVPLPLVDLGDVPEDRRDADVARRCEAEARAPFDLTRGPLLRALALRLGADDHVLLLNVHHAVFDWWSIQVLMSEVIELYRAVAGARPAPLPEPPPVRYRDFAVWQRDRVATGQLTGQLEHWRRRLDGAPASLRLPADHPRPVVRTSAGALVRFEIPAGVAGGLRRLAGAAGATLFATLLAGFAALLSRRSGQTDVVVGTAVDGRDQPGMDRMIGLFLNTLALRCDCTGDPSFRELVERARDVTVEALSHQDLPFERLVEELQPERDLSRSPVFQVVFQVLPAGRALAAAAGATGLRITPVDLDRRAAQFDLLVTVRDGDGALEATAEYSTDLFERATVARLMAQYGRLLAAGAEDPELALSRLEPPVPASEAEEVVTRLWAELLGLERVGVHDDFFALGGDSLGAHRTVAGLRERCGVELPLSSVFERPTAAELGAGVERARASRR